MVFCTRRFEPGFTAALVVAHAHLAIRPRIFQNFSQGFCRLSLLDAVSPQCVVKTPLGIIFHEACAVMRRALFALLSDGGSASNDGYRSPQRRFASTRVRVRRIISCTGLLVTCPVRYETSTDLILFKTRATRNGWRCNTSIRANNCVFTFSESLPSIMGFPPDGEDVVRSVQFEHSRTRAEFGNRVAVLLSCCLAVC